MTTDVARTGIDGLVAMRKAADRRLRRRSVSVSVLVVVLLTTTVTLGFLAWPRIETFAWVQTIRATLQAGDEAPGPAAEVGATPVTTGPVRPPSDGDALLITQWATWNTSDGGAFGAQIMLRRATDAAGGTAALWFLYPGGSAPPNATVPVTHEGQAYLAVLTEPSRWTDESGLATHADVVCDAGSPRACSGTRAIAVPAVPPERTVPALIVNAIQSADGTFRVLSAASVESAPRSTRCALMPCS